MLIQRDDLRDRLTRLLDAEKLEAFKATVESLFADIAHEHRLLRKESAAGKDPQAGRLPILCAAELTGSWRSEAPLISIGAQSHLDGAAANVAAMLAQSHGVPARVEPPSTLTAANLASLDLSDAALICVYSDMQTPARLHYVARRVKATRRLMQRRLMQSSCSRFGRRPMMLWLTA